MTRRAPWQSAKGRPHEEGGAVMPKNSSATKRELTGDPIVDSIGRYFRAMSYSA